MFYHDVFIGILIKSIYRSADWLKIKSKLVQEGAVM